MTDTMQRADRERAALGAVLLGQTGRPRGARPKEDELAAWAEQRLTGPRRAEVESHIACDPAVFDAAMRRARVSAQRDALGGDARGGARDGWRYALAASVAVVGLALFWAFGWQRAAVPPLSPSTPTGLPGSTVLRGPDAPHPDWRVVAFRAGYWQAEAAAAADRAGERADFSACVDAADCGPYVDELVRFGEALARVRSACEIGALEDTERRSVEILLREIDAGIAPSLELARWRSQLARLQTALGAGFKQTCAEADAIRELLLRD